MENCSSFSKPLVIPVTTISVNLILENENPVSAFHGATFRGGFGYTLRSLVCVTGKKTCENCLFLESCAYSFLFETPPPPNSVRMAKYRAVPHPFAMVASQEKSSLKVDLKLFGEAYRYIPHFIYTLNKLGTKGIGKNRTKFTVKDALWDGKVIYSEKSTSVEPGITPLRVTVIPGEPKQGKIRLRFVTPLTIKKDGKELLRFDKKAFFTSLLRRITNLNAFYGVDKSINIDPMIYLKPVEGLTVQDSMRVENRTRFSTRQKKKLDYSGLTGEVTIEGETGTLFPLLRAGEITGVGKNTVFGSGVYEMEVQG
ncbi:MAG: CRISPR system precrRNA processing endoribonuclease RAMP protein Cas6 [Fibrobacter sp.]|nr:CRISPR system precrRNA processing endoribonuclease RAMP protein Cas6 [Fibrobacter sp.]